MEDGSLKAESGDTALEGLGDRWLSREVNWVEVKGMQILGLAESARKQGQRDVVTIGTARAAKGAGRIRAVLPDRTKEPVQAFLARLPKGVQPAIRTGCTDLAEGFSHAVKEG